MPALAPADAAYAAGAIYNLIYQESLEAFGTGLDDKFAIGAGRRLEGEAGALLWKDTTGFAVVARGRSGTAYADEALIVIRGSRKNVKDLVLTDGNVAIRRSHGGHPVHAGFEQCFGTFKKALARHMRGWNPGRIHCVGHSLGGALAALTAEWIRAEGMARTDLYTFGSPRVGTQGFATNLTKAVHADNIYRVSHRADLVTMIPLWPFVHVPTPGIDCFLDKGGHLPSVAWHDMGRYHASVKGATWAGLRQPAPETDWKGNVREWLDAEGFVDFSMRSIRMIQHAIVYLIGKICHAAGVPIQLLLTTGLTVLDALSMLLHKGLRIGGELSAMTASLLRKILQATGHMVRKVADATATFVRWVVSSFASAVYQAAARAVDAAHPS